MGDTPHRENGTTMANAKELILCTQRVKSTPPPHHSENANWKISTSSIQHPHTHIHPVPVSISFCLLSASISAALRFFVLFACRSSVYFSFVRQKKKDLFYSLFFISHSHALLCSADVHLDFLFFGCFISMLCSHILSFMLAFYLHNPKRRSELTEKKTHTQSLSLCETMKSKESNILLPTHSISTEIYTHTVNTMQSLFFAKRIGTQLGWKIRNQKRKKEQKKRRVRETYCYHVVTYLLVCVNMCRYFGAIHTDYAYYLQIHTENLSGEHERKKSIQHLDHRTNCQYGWIEMCLRIWWR